MKILHYSTEPSWRGGENQLKLLVDGLRDRGIECHLAVQRASKLALALKGQQGVLQLSSFNDLDFLAAWRLAQYCRKHAIDLLDTHTARAHAIGLMVVRLVPGLRLVVHRRVLSKIDGGFFDRLKYLSPRVNRFVAISSAIGESLAAFGVPPARISVVCSAVDEAPYAALDHDLEREALAKSLGLPQDVPWIGNAAHFSPLKGHATLLGALAKLKEKNIRFHCLLAGDGEARPEVARQAARLGLGDQVTFLGFRDDVPRILRSLDVFVLPSEWEGLGTIVQEALYAGNAVVATRVGGIPEMIEHEKSGLLFEAGNDLELAAHLERLLVRPELRHSYAVCGLSMMREKFSLAAMVEGNLRVYHELALQR